MFYDKTELNTQLVLLNKKWNYIFSSKKFLIEKN